MKTYKHLYQDVCSFQGLLAAYLRARKGKHGKPDAGEFHVNLEENLLRLESELTHLSYEPGGYTNFIITDPKRRVISRADFADRVVHHAVCRVLAPIYEKRFIFDSYA